MVDCIRWRESQLLDLAMNSCLIYAFINIPIAAALDQDLRSRTIDCGGQQHPGPLGLLESRFRTFQSDREGRGARVGRRILGPVAYTDVDGGPNFPNPRFGLQKPRCRSLQQPLSPVSGRRVFTLMGRLGRAGAVAYVTYLSGCGGRIYGCRLHTLMGRVVVGLGRLSGASC